MVIVCMAMIDDRRQRMMMFWGWKLYCGDFVGGRLTLTLKYQFSLILESAGQKVFFACFHVFMFSCFLFILWNSFTFTAWESRGCFIQRNGNRYFRTWHWVQSYLQSQLFRLNISLEAPFIWSSSFLNKSRCLSQLDYTAHFWKAFVTRCFRAIISDHYPDTFQETFPFPIS